MHDIYLKTTRVISIFSLSMQPPQILTEVSKNVKLKMKICQHYSVLKNYDFFSHSLKKRCSKSVI